MREPAATTGPPNPRRRHARWRSVAVAALTSGALLAGPAPATATATASAVTPRASTISAYDAVDPFIGTELDPTQNKGNSAYGNTWPGATTPFGMVQSSPTTYRSSDGDRKGGYEYSADKLRGFGMTRLSGTGCEGRFSAFDFPVLPYTGRLDGGALPTSPGAGIEPYYLDFDHRDETAAPGHYTVGLGNGVETELTATTRTAVNRYEFPARKDSATLILDVAGSNNRVFDSEVKVEGRTVSGWVETASVCDEGGRYRAYFSSTFDRAFTSYGTWQGGEVTPGAASARGGAAQHGSGAYLVFPKGATVTARTGLSYVSVANAARNAEEETGGRTFDQVRKATAQTWKDALSTVKVTGGTKSERVKFFTALYHSLLHPNVSDDVNGQYPGHDGKIRKVAPGRHHYVTYAGWDMYRGQAQLVALLFPKVGDDINQSLVDLVKQTGAWPNWPHLNQSQQKMSGDSLQVVLSSIDAFGSVDYDRKAALASMRKTQQLPAGTTKRAHAQQYFSAGFIDNGKGDSATSKTLEYAIDDFAIAQLAGRLGEKATHDQFMVRAQNWQNLLDPETQRIRPRGRNGFDRSFNLGERGNQFEQATGYQYGWMVPQNLGTLIEKRGGAEQVTRDLDEHTRSLDAGVYNTTGAYLSNQPSFSMPYVYNWLGRPDRTSEVLRRATDEMYDTTPSGLPGNDDLGSLSAWYVWANLGMNPMVYGTANLVLSSPMFDRIVIDSAGSDRRITVRAEGAAADRPYVTALKVNGAQRTQSWLSEDFARAGGVLTYTMGAAPGTWGTGPADVPPSYTDGSDARNNTGSTPDGRGGLGSLDLSDNSLSREKLAAAGAAPGAKLPLGDTGVTFTWPKAKQGQPDNWIPHGQRVNLTGGNGRGTRATGISFLGLATNGPSQGMARVEYEDGSTQNVAVQFTDWTPGTDYLYGNVPLVVTEGRNKVNGTSDTTRTVVFGTVPQVLDAKKRVRSVVLPQGTDRGIMHIFDVALTANPDLEAPGAVPERIVLTPTATPATSQAVTWRTGSGTTSGEARYREAGSDAAWRKAKAVTNEELLSSGVPTRTHSAVMEDLKPGTRYEYRVGTGDRLSEQHAFTSAGRPGEEFTFLYFGDAQNDLKAKWAPVVDLAYQRFPKAVGSVNAGDLVDSGGNAGQWDEWFGAMNGRSQTTNVIAAPGNHEYNADLFLKTWKSTFEYPANGPTPLPAKDETPAERQRAAYEAHMAKSLTETAYYTDYQGVRFITLNASTHDARELMTPPNLPPCPEGCPDPQKLWLDLQARWLDHILADNPNKWSVATFHQPVFSAAVGRDEKPVRDAWLPVFQRNDIDLVLMGHDHVYARGYVDADATDTPGVTTGPVYAVAMSGPKYYELSPADDNVWTRNGPTQVARAAHTSTFQGITVTQDTIRYESVVAAKWDDRSTTDKQVGEVLDAFTITKSDAGVKYVTEDGVGVPGGR
ncbi:alpha-mannosidase [Streptomyces sp. SID8359]|uniref:GH92 family glycosyl hydrolase n=1 Tax=unclassified Streptomyces TaxID=2593676 RepID=UPI00048FCE07|nr:MULTISPECIES: GH92 family glycosyl hydrolase [unclassified Streptomyces]MYT89941.1 alpha-mannosidase [Streptomyces sp. SID8359]